MTRTTDPSRRPTLASWLFAAVFGTAVVAVLLCAALIGRYVREEVRAQASDFLQTNADALRDALDRGMAQHYEEVRFIAQLDQVSHGDPAAVRRALEQVRAGFPQFAWLGLADSQGRVLAAADGLLEGANVAARPWFAGAAKGTFVGDVHKAVLLEKLLPVQAEPWRFVDIATPVPGADGTTRGVLGAHLSWAWAARIKRELVDQPLERHGAEALVLSADGTVLLGPKALQGRVVAAAGNEGLLTVSSATRGADRYPGLGWQVVLRQPEAVAMAPFHALRSRIAIAVGALCMLITPFVLLLARRLASPLWALTSRLGTDPSAAAPAALQNPLYEEAALLGRALDRYARRQADDAAALRQLNAGLEQRVVERTGALAASEQRLAASEQLLRAVTDNLPVLISYVDRDQRVRFLNATFAVWGGIDIQRAIGRPLSELRDAASHQHSQPHLLRALAGERAEFEEDFVAGGRRRTLQTVYVPDLRPDQPAAGVYAVCTDITAIKSLERQLLQLAHTDALTGLDNRHSFNEKLAAALARGRRSRQPLGLLFLDIDRFKSINDTFGHAVGDQVLMTFAARLSAAVRETDTVARLAGDEFVVVLEGLQAPAQAQQVARKIIAAIARPFALHGATIDVGASIGVAFQHDLQASAEQLLAAADQALYDAKENGRNTCRMGLN